MECFFSLKDNIDVTVQVSSRFAMNFTCLFSTIANHVPSSPSERFFYEHVYSLGLSCYPSKFQSAPFNLG